MDYIIAEAEKDFANFTFVVEEGPLIDEPEEEPVNLHCEKAEKFYAWCSAIIADLGTYPSDAKLNTYELSLQRTYWEWYKQAPKACRSYRGINGTKCIHSIWQDTFDAIMELRLSRMPPVLKEKVEEKEKAKEPIHQVTGAPIGMKRKNAPHPQMPQAPG